MTLKDRLMADLQESMKKGDTVRRDVIRYLRAAIGNEEVTRKVEALDDAAVAEVIARQVKQRRESIEGFKKGNRQDLVAKEEAELSILAAYLPQQMSRDELTALARQAIKDVGAQGPADRGKVMGRLMSLIKGKADGRDVNEVVAALLSNPSS